MQGVISVFSEPAIDSTQDSIGKALCLLKNGSMTNFGSWEQLGEGITSSSKSP
jgi:hypothetical protein